MKMQLSLVDPMCDQGGHMPTLKLKKKKSIYKFKKHEFAKVPTLILVFDKKKNIY